jgi:hypothetical protein
MPRFAGRENHFQVYRRENMPARYHYTDNPRIPPVVLLANEGWYISKYPVDPTRTFESATHGFDPQLESMGATFIAYARHFVMVYSCRWPRPWTSIICFVSPWA